MKVKSFLAVTASIVLGACSRSSSSWSTFQNQDHGIEVTYPSNWRVRDGSYFKWHPYRVLAVSNKWRTIDVVERVGGEGTELTIDIIPNKGGTSLRKLRGAHAVLVKERRGVFEGEIYRDMSPNYSNVEFIYKSAIYKISCMSESREQQQKVAPICERMLSSIKIL